MTVIAQRVDNVLDFVLSRLVALLLDFCKCHLNRITCIKLLYFGSVKDTEQDLSEIPSTARCIRLNRLASGHVHRCVGLMCAGVAVCVVKAGRNARALLGWVSSSGERLVYRSFRDLKVCKHHVEKVVCDLVVVMHQFQGFDVKRDLVVKRAELAEHFHVHAGIKALRRVIRFSVEVPASRHDASSIRKIEANIDFFLCNFQDAAQHGHSPDRPAVQHEIARWRVL
mmetsp:Transcript_21036/g.37266  ORF Transcript_21036/g.37266 Transcript_21036/m.37266 type:complete len:226 (+) Transcript_21036:443-1120(+)